MFRSIGSGKRPLMRIQPHEVITAPHHLVRRFSADRCGGDLRRHTDHHRADLPDRRYNSPFGITVTLATPPPTQFQLPVQITGAASLQTWQFDLVYDSTVVKAVDPLTGLVDDANSAWGSGLAFCLTCLDYPADARDR